MTISTTTRKAGPFIGSGSTASFPFAFKVFTTADVYVVRTNSASGVDTALSLGTDYTVTLNANQNTAPGGTVTLTGGALAAGFNLTITSAVEAKQPVDLTNSGGFFPAVVTNALDRLTILVQQALEQINRSLKVAVSTPPGVRTTLPVPVPNKLIGWDESGTNLQNMDAGVLATIVAFGTAKADLFAGNGVQTQFTLSANPGALANLRVAQGGAVLRPGVDYTWSGGTTLTMTTPVPNGTSLLVQYMQALPQGATDSAAATFLPFGTGAVTRNVQVKVREARKSVEDFGGVADGVTNNDSAIGLAAAASGGRFHFPGPGTYVCSASVWGYAFTAGDNVVLKISGTNYDVSNAIAGPWRMTVDSPVLMSLRHAVTGNIVQQWQDGTGGTATYFYRGLAFKCDSHFIQAKPATNGGACDILFQRSELNADPNGNRFNFTFNESVDRLDFSFATSASGAPVFDSFMQVVAGPSATLAFPAIRPQFNLGVSVKQRAAGGFEMVLEPTSSTVTRLRQVGGSATEFMRFGDNSMGFFGAAGGSRPTITGSRGGNVALTNLLANLAALGLITDSTTA